MQNTRYTFGMTQTTGPTEAELLARIAQLEAEKRVAQLEAEKRQGNDGRVSRRT